MKPRIPLRIYALVVSTVALAAFWTASGWTGRPAASFWFWLGACLVGELLWIRLPVGRATVSMASCVHFAALLVLPCPQAMLIAAVTGPVAEALFMRKPLIRAFFNGGQATLAVGCASWMLGMLGGSASSPAQIALAVAAVVYFVVNTGMVSVAVALNERIPFAWAWRANFGTRHELISNGALFSLGALLASHYAAHGIGGTLLVILPLLVAHEGYRRCVESRAEPPIAQERAAA